MNNEKGFFEINGARFKEDEIRIPMDIVPPHNLNESDIPKYESVDHKHYIASEVLYFQDRQWLKGCAEHRTISEREMNEEISDHLEKMFRWSYYQRWKDDPNRIMVLDDIK